MNWYAQMQGSGQSDPVVPLTVARETAILTLLHELLPPIFLGIGPQWARVASVSGDAAATTANVSLLLNTFVPIIGNDTSDTFPEVTMLELTLLPATLRLLNMDCCGIACRCCLVASRNSIRACLPCGARLKLRAPRSCSTTP